MDKVSLDLPRTIQPVPLDCPSPADVLYPDFPDFAAPIAPSSKGEDDTIETPPTATAPLFVIDSLAKADWAVAKIIDAEARISRRSELAAELHARIDTWLEKASIADNDSISYLSSLLRPWVESELASQHRSRSVSLPSGIAQLRKLPDRLDVTDPEAAMVWATKHRPDAVIIKKDLSRSVLKAIILNENEAIPGCSFELGSDQLFVRPNA